MQPPSTASRSRNFLVRLQLPIWRNVMWGTGYQIMGHWVPNCGEDARFKSSTKICEELVRYLHSIYHYSQAFTVQVQSDSMLSMTVANSTLSILRRTCMLLNRMLTKIYYRYDQCLLCKMQLQQIIKEWIHTLYYQQLFEPSFPKIAKASHAYMGQVFE